MNTKSLATGCAILAAALYAINIPLAKLLLVQVEPTMLAALLYLGAGLGMIIYRLCKKLLGKPQRAASLTRKELPYTLAMIILDIAAPILLMLGISQTNSANVSLLNNFEIVATSLIALLLFKEVISHRLWLAIGLVTLASIILSFEGSEAFVFNQGSLLVLGACICWGFENNSTKMLSNKSSEEIVIIKGCCSGLGSLSIALLLGEAQPALLYLAAALLLGFVAYGMSINFYILAQKDLGAAKTSAYYSIAPFLGVAFSLLLLGEQPSYLFYIGLVLMIISTYFMVMDTIELQHTHLHTHIHSHPHRHGKLVHTHSHSHQHSHLHIHSGDANSHSHQHQELGGSHDHLHDAVN